MVFCSAATIAAVGAPAQPVAAVAAAAEPFAAVAIAASAEPVAADAAIAVVASAQPVAAAALAPGAGMPVGALSRSAVQRSGCQQEYLR